MNKSFNQDLDELLSAQSELTIVSHWRSDCTAKEVARYLKKRQKLYAKFLKKYDKKQLTSTKADVR